MALQDLIDADQAAKAYNGKHGAPPAVTAANELPCKYYQPTVALSTHTPPEDWKTATVGGQTMWRLTQLGAKKVWAEYARLRNEGLLLFSNSDDDRFTYLTGGGEGDNLRYK